MATALVRGKNTFSGRCKHAVVVLLCPSSRQGTLFFDIKSLPWSRHPAARDVVVECCFFLIIAILARPCGAGRIYFQLPRALGIRMYAFLRAPAALGSGMYTFLHAPDVRIFTCIDAPGKYDVFTRSCRRQDVSFYVSRSSWAEGCLQLRFSFNGWLE